MGRFSIDELMKRMDEGVIQRLGHYVYRLIDPRNGETFYVGVGKGKRVLDHVKGVPDPDMVSDANGDDEVDLKLDRINQIMKSGFEVGHIIHRHGIPDAGTARIVEAALIDAYPGLSNRVGGHGSSDYGCRHLEQIITESGLPEFVATEPLILISIGRSFESGAGSVYGNTRRAWRANLKNAEQYRLVLAHSGGVVRGVFRPVQWVEATKENFPDLEADMPKRIGFIGDVAEEEVVEHYLEHRVPEQYRARGAANPFRYINPA